MSGMKLLLSDARGVYIPRDFALAYDAKRWNVKPEYMAEIARGPHDNPEYWDTWNEVMCTAELTDDKGNSWFLYQDGDLWAYCVQLMTREEQMHMFGSCDEELL